MPVSRTLIENGRINHTRLSDPWTMDDVFTEIKRQNLFTNPEGQTVHLLVDLRETRHFPPNTLRMRDLPAFSGKQQRKMAVVGATGIAPRIFELVEVMRALKLDYFESYDQALGFLRSAIANESAAVTDQSHVG